MSLRILIDRELCMGSGSCAFFAPATFDVDDDMKAVVLIDASTAASADAADAVRRAADACPTRAITLWIDGDRVVPV